MIQYDPHKWFDHFFDLKGSLIREISGRVAFCAVWSAVIVAVNMLVRPLGTSLLLHTLVGVPLGLLLVFRTNASYDRFWEGRKLWGAIVNDSRNLVRGALVHFGGDEALLRAVTHWTVGFVWSAMASLRGKGDLGPVASELPAFDRESAESAQHVPYYCAQRITMCLAAARDKGLISDYILALVDRHTAQLMDSLGGCERIRKTPLPFAYVVHLRRALVIYCYTLPFALVDTFGWWSILAVILVAYTFFGIEEIGVEIEGPFGYDDNDLPLEQICTTIQENLYSAARLRNSPREAPIGEP
jgi:putative membrane protein